MLRGKPTQAAPTTAAIKDYGLKEYVHLSKNLPHAESTPWQLVCTLPYNCQFQPWIQAEAPAVETCGPE